MGWPELGSAVVPDSRDMGTNRREAPKLPPHGASRAVARELGITAWQWRDPRYERPFHGVRAAPSFNMEASNVVAPHPAQVWRTTHVELLRAYTCVMKPRQFFAGVTSALIWNLPIPIDARVLQQIEVGVETGAPLPRRVGVQGRRFVPRLTRVVRKDGIPTLDPPSIWATLGPRLDLPARVALGDAIVHRPRIGGDRGPVPRPAHATLDQLVAISEQRGRVGKVKLFEALPLLRTGSASAPESHLRLALVMAGLPEPSLDVDIYHANGRYLGTTECAYPMLKIALEYEGDHHRTVTQQWNRDIQKYQDYEEAGWKIIRITATMLYRRRREITSQIRRAMLARRRHPDR